jgi:hypothetical protein
MFVEYTFEQQLFFGEINCDPNPEKWWVKKILQSEKGTPRNTMYRSIGNYSKDCDKYKAVFTGLKEIDLTNAKNGNVYFFPEWKLAYAVNNHILDDKEIEEARKKRKDEYEIGGKGLFEFKLDDMIKKNNEEQIVDMDKINEDITQKPAILDFDVLIPKSVIAPDSSTTLSNVASNVVSDAVSNVVSDAVSKGKEAVSNIEETLTKDKDQTPSESIQQIENIRYTYSEYFFDCPKFRQILIQLILMKTGYMYVSNKDVNGEDKIGLIEQPHLTTTEKYNAEKINNYGIEMPFGDGDYDMRNYQELAHSNINEAAYYYLPLVWSCSVEMGLNNFGFWLSELGFKYITLHPDHAGYKNELDRGLKRSYPLMEKQKTEEIKQRLNKFFESQSSEDTDELIKYFLKIPNIRETPICILLHPDLVEGVDCVYNPSLIAMEPANTYGDYEQLCGRVLRTYPKGGFEPDKTNPNKNPINKVIYQYSSYNSVNLKNIMDKQFFFGEEPEYFKKTGYDIFYKENKSVLNNIFISVQQEKNKNKSFMENIVNNTDNEKRFKDFDEMVDYYFKNGTLPSEYKDAIKYIYEIFESFKNMTQKVIDITDIISSITTIDISEEKINQLINLLKELREDLNTCYNLTLLLADIFNINEKLEKLIKPIYNNTLSVIKSKLDAFGIKSKFLDSPGSPESIASFKDVLNENITLIKNLIIENILNFSVGRMKIPDITKLVEKFTNNVVNIDVSFFTILKSGEDLGNNFNKWVDYFKTISTELPTTGKISEMPDGIKEIVESYTISNFKNDELIQNLFNSNIDLDRKVRETRRSSGGQLGGDHEQLKNFISKTKNTLTFFKPLFSTLENFVNKVIIHLKNGIKNITSSIEIPREIQEIYEKYLSNNETINKIVGYFSNIRNAIDTLYNLDYSDSGKYKSILEAVENQENINRLFELIKEKNTYLSDQLTYLRDSIYPVFKSVYESKFFKTYIIGLANAYVKINENPKIKSLRDKENAFTNNTILNLTSKYLYTYAIASSDPLFPDYERNKLLNIFGENGISIYDAFITDLKHKIPPYFIQLALNDWTGNYDNYLAQYKSDLSKKIFKRKELEFKLIKYENSDMVKLNREQYGEEKRIRDIFNKAAPSFQSKGDNIDMIKLQIDKNIANLTSLAIENESPDLNKLMELRIVQQDIEIVKNYILQGEGEKEDLIGFTDLSQIENCIDSLEDDAKIEALNAIWCDPLYPTNDTLCLNTSIKKPKDFFARNIELTGGKRGVIKSTRRKKDKTSGKFTLRKNNRVIKSRRRKASRNRHTKKFA